MEYIEGLIGLVRGAMVTALDAVAGLLRGD